MSAQNSPIFSSHVHKKTLYGDNFGSRDFKEIMEHGNLDTLGWSSQISIKSLKDVIVLCRSKVRWEYCLLKRCGIALNSVKHSQPQCRSLTPPAQNHFEKLWDKSALSMKHIFIASYLKQLVLPWKNLSFCICYPIPPHFQ